MALPSISASDWVAKMTEAFFFRRVLSHSRNCPAEAAVVESEPALIDDQQRGPAVEPVLDAVEQVGQHCGRGVRANQPLGLERLHIGLAETLGLGVEQSAPRTTDRVGLQRLLQRIGLQED